MSGVGHRLHKALSSRHRPSVEFLSPVDSNNSVGQNYCAITLEITHANWRRHATNQARTWTALLQAPKQLRNALKPRNLRPPFSNCVAWDRNLLVVFED